MRKVTRFTQNVDILVKGRKPVAIGTKSPDGKRIKTVDGWKPVKRQRKSTSKSTASSWKLSYFDDGKDEWTVKKFDNKREATKAHNTHGGELTDGKVVRKKRSPPKFFVGGGSRVAADGSERIDRLKRRLVEMKKKGYKPKTSVMGGDVNVSDAISSTEESVKNARKELKLGKGYGNRV